MFDFGWRHGFNVEFHGIWIAWSSLSLFMVTYLFNQNIGSEFFMDWGNRTGFQWNSI